MGLSTYTTSARRVITLETGILPFIWRHIFCLMDHSEGRTLKGFIKVIFFLERFNFSEVAKGFSRTSSEKREREKRDFRFSRNLSAFWRLVMAKVEFVLCFVIWSMSSSGRANLCARVVCWGESGDYRYSCMYIHICKKTYLWIC